MPTMAHTILMDHSRVHISRFFESKFTFKNFEKFFGVIFFKNFHFLDCVGLGEKFLAELYDEKSDFLDVTDDYGFRRLF